MSDGTTVTAPKFLRRAARELKRLWRDLSRKAKGSSNLIAHPDAGFVRAETGFAVYRVPFGTWRFTGTP